MRAMIESLWVWIPQAESHLPFWWLWKVEPLGSDQVPREEHKDEFGDHSKEAWETVSAPFHCVKTKEASVLKAGDSAHHHSIMLTPDHRFFNSQIYSVFQPPRMWQFAIKVQMDLPPAHT